MLGRIAADKPPGLSHRPAGLDVRTDSAVGHKTEHTGSPRD